MKDRSILLLLGAIVSYVYSINRKTYLVISTTLHFHAGSHFLSNLHSSYAHPTHKSPSPFRVADVEDDWEDKVEWTQLSFEIRGSVVTDGFEM